jgi:PTS system cellobiose-specific IIC component
VIESTATAGTELQVFTPAFFDSFVHLGGAGAIIGLLIAIILVSKRQDYKEVSKVSLPASSFQISEPAMYGLPIVLNPLLFIPFLIIPLVLTVIAYLATIAGIAGYTYVAIPWTTPPVLGAFLSTGGDFGAALIALVNLLVAIVMYYPFVVMANKHGDI